MRLLQYRFMLMCLAALEAPLNLPIDGSLYGEEVIFVANDWHAALVPVYLASKYRPHGVYTDARSILAIHNLRHQVCPPSCERFLKHVLNTRCAIWLWPRLYDTFFVPLRNCCSRRGANITLSGTGCTTHEA